MHPELRQYIRKIRIRDISEYGEESSEIIVDPQDLQVRIREVTCRDGIAEIEETELDNVLLVEEVLEFHQAFRFERMSGTILSRRHCDFLPVIAPNVVTQYGTQYVRTILRIGGINPIAIVSPWLIDVRTVPTINAVISALLGVPSPKIICESVGGESLTFVEDMIFVDR